MNHRATGLKDGALATPTVLRFAEVKVSLVASAVVSVNAAFAPRFVKVIIKWCICMQVQLDPCTSCSVASYFKCFYFLGSVRK